MSRLLKLKDNILLLAAVADSLTSYEKLAPSEEQNPTLQ